MDSQCLIALVEMAPMDIALGLILGPIGTPASWVPQHLKMRRLKSTEGLSAFTFVGLVFTFSCSVSNALILHWRQLLMCGGVGGNATSMRASSFVAATMVA